MIKEFKEANPFQPIFAALDVSGPCHHRPGLESWAGLKRSPAAIWSTLDAIHVLLLYTVYPIGSMGIYANIWGILMVNVTIHSIHGSYGYFNHISFILLLVVSFCSSRFRWKRTWTLRHVSHQLDETKQKLEDLERTFASNMGEISRIVSNQNEQNLLFNQQIWANMEVWSTCFIKGYP